MKIKATGILLALAVLLAMAAMPAAAADGVGPHAGVFQGIADVGKGGSCDGNGNGTVTGGGIGLLPAVDAKVGYWKIDAGLVVDAPNGIGTAKLCGNLEAPLSDLSGGATDALGATCSSTSGTNGSGTATWPGIEYNINDLIWHATVGGTILVTGDIGDTKGKDGGVLIAEVQALSEGVVLGCIDKTQGNKADPDPFTVVAVYEIVSAP